MPDESAELVGGIEVEVGATHARLVADLEAANRVLDTWSKQTFNVQVGAGVAAPAAQPARQGPVRATPPPPIRYGAAATTGAQAGQGQTALQRAINAELAKTGEIYDANNNEAVSATRAVRQQREAVSQLQQTASEGVGLSLDPSFQTSLETSLRTLREIVAEATKLASIGAKVDVPALPPPAPVHPAARPVTPAVTQVARSTPAVVSEAAPVVSARPAPQPGLRPQAPIQAPEVPEVRTQEAVPPARARRVAREEARAVTPVRVEEARVEPAPVETAQPVAQPARAVVQAPAAREESRVTQPERIEPEIVAPARPRRAAQVAPVEPVVEQPVPVVRPRRAVAPVAPVVEPSPVAPELAPVEPVAPPRTKAVRQPARVPAPVVQPVVEAPRLEPVVQPVRAPEAVRAEEARVQPAPVAPVAARPAPVAPVVEPEPVALVRTRPVRQPARAAQPVRVEPEPIAPIEPVVEQPARVAPARRPAPRVVQPARVIEEPEEAVEEAPIAAAAPAPRRPARRRPAAAPVRVGEEPEAPEEPAEEVPVAAAPPRRRAPRRAPTRVGGPPPAPPVDEDEEPQEAPGPKNKGGRVGILRQPRISEYEGGPFGNQGGAIQYAKPITAAPAIALQTPLRVVNSPQQRAAEREMRDRARADEATVRQNAAQAAAAERSAREAFLNEPPPGGYAEAPPSATIAPQRPPDRNEDAEHALNRPAVPSDADRARQRQGGARQRAEEQARLDQLDRDPFNRPAEPTTPARLTPDQRQRQSFEQRAAQAEFRRSIQQAEIERRIDQARATQQAQIVAAGRTARTQASSLGGFFGGPRREQIEAQTDLAAATRDTASAQRYLSVFENEMIRNRVRAESATRSEARALHARNREIETSPAYQRALEGQTVAIDREAAATQRLEKLSSGFGTAARSLLAVTAAGSAFGIGLKAVDVVLGAVTPALGEFIDIQTGFGASSTRITSGLAQQTLQLKGNATAALAAAEAQAGLSTSGADAVSQQLLLTTQIKAGALAQQQASDLFKAGAGQGNAPTGLYGGYGGIGGTSFFAEQMGGGRGFTENVLKDVEGLRGRQGPDLLGNANAGLSYLGSAGVRATVGEGAKASGDIPGQIIDTISRLPGGLGDRLAGLNPFGKGALQDELDRQRAGREKEIGPSSTQQAYVTDQNATAIRGAGRLGDTAQATLAYTNDPGEIAAATRAAAAAGDQYGATLANQEHLVLRLNDAVVKSADDYARAASQFAVGRGIQDPGQISRLAIANEQQRQIESRASAGALKAQFEFERPATLNRLQREQDFALQTQIPAQAALQNLAAPPTAVGTGIVTRNSSEQGKVNANLKEANDLQSSLNDYYAQGFNILRDTYQVPVGLLTQIQSIGSEIASTQASIANGQAKYQVAQFNFQLMIARRTLSDINGLTGRNFGGQGQSYLGQLERENLALGRQGQLLAFALSQRQLNFQRAVAGFQVPGLTPAEQNARVEEARITTSFAQKQLDIQKEMFGNQVQIVDIGNLRQGADLAKQIGLLLQGRELTISTAAAQQKLARLQAQQQILVQQAGTYIAKVNAQAADAMSEMEALEKATGKAITATERQGIAAAYNVGRAFFIGISGGFLSGGGGQVGTPRTQENLQGSSSGLHATGGVFNTQGATNLGPFGTAGEAGGETVAILAHPRALTGASAGGGGGGNVYVTFGDVQIRTEADFQRLYRMVLDALGRDAATKGLRTPF